MKIYLRCNNIVSFSAPKAKEPFVCPQKIDVAFLIDASSSITNQWGNLKHFLTEVIKAFHIGEKEVLVSIVTYATTPRRVLDLNQVKNKDLLLAVIKTLEQQGGGTRIDLALEFAADKVFVQGHGDREEVVDVVVLLTDGKSDPGSKPLDQAVLPLRRESVHVIAVGLGHEIDEHELRAVITDKANGLFLIKEYAEMSDYVTSLAKGICDSKLVLRSHYLFLLLKYIAHKRNSFSLSTFPRPLTRLLRVSKS